MTPQISSAKAPVNPSGFAISRGINISHWLSQDFGWAPKNEWFTENDMRYIASIGFDHVRLPVDEIELWNVDGSANEANFTMLKDALGWASENGLRVIVDLHSVRAHHFNASNEGKHNTLWTDPAAQEHFIGLWKQLSARLCDYPNDFLAYEIMNEPTAPDPEDWNKLVTKTIDYIRSVEPERVIVIGADMWQTPQLMPFLKVPEGDRNIILSMHTYEPLLFTHHTASWIDGPIQTYTGPVNYPGPIIDKATFDTLAGDSRKLAHPLSSSVLDNWGPERFLVEIAPAVKRAQELGLQLYCGEFGSLPTVPRAARLAYYRDIVGVFEANGIAWANWEYKGDFGITEWHGLKSLDGAPDVQMIDALMQR
ncbi:MAG: cellulase family glycosylhydrolase [Opitutales bacterium]